MPQTGNSVLNALFVYSIRLWWITFKISSFQCAAYSLWFFAELKTTWAKRSSIIRLLLLLSILPLWNLPTFHSFHSCSSVHTPYFVLFRLIVLLGRPIGIMKSFQIALLAAFGSVVAGFPSNISARAVSSVVTGTPFGFASAVTGGGTAAPV